MPLSGNRLGPREKYVYVADDDSNYVIETDQDLAVAGLGDGATAPTVFDPQNPGTAGPPPKRFKPRVVFAQASSGERKNLIAFSSTADLYSSDQSQSVTIDTLAFSTTGRRGEKLTF